MKTIHEYTITTQCTCSWEEGETGYCSGECFDWQLCDFMERLHDFMESNSTYYFQIGGIKLWDREVGGIAHCINAVELLNAMTVKSDWSMKYTVHADCIEYSLSHHDAPMGSTSFVRHATDEQIENNRY
jgi:hypothetical protein